MQPTKIKTTKTQNTKLESVNVPEIADTKVGQKFKSPTEHLWRKLLAGFLGVMVFWLAIIAVDGIWFSQTITSTERFTSTLAPLASNVKIQAFIAQKVTDNLLEKASPADLEKQFLTASQIKKLTPAQAQVALRPKIESTIRSTIDSPAFISLWAQTVTNTHAQALAIAKSNSPTASLNFSSELNSFVNLLSKTKIGKNITPQTINNDSGNVELKTDQLKTLRRGYANLKNAAYVYIAALLVLIGLTVFVANRRLHSLRNLGLAIAVAMGLTVASISALGRAHFANMDQQEQGAAQAAISGIFASLKHLSSLVGIVSLIMALAIIFTPYVQKQLVRLKK